MKRNFTLVELLVSLGVFSILLVVFMQLFSGMRLAWTNTERHTDSSYSARVAMDMLSVLVGSMYYTNASTDLMENTVQFPFKLERSSANSADPAALYFASKTNIDLPGSNPVRFIGVQYVSPQSNFGLSEALPREKERFYKLYLTTVSNAKYDGGERDISATNRAVYHCFWPAPDFLDPADSMTIVDVGGALDKLTKLLDSKLKPDDAGYAESIELLENVTEFKIRLFDSENNELGKDKKAISQVPHSVEVTLSLLTPNDFENWRNSGNNEEYKRKNQKTFTRRIHIGDRWNMEKKYDVY